MRLNLSKVPRKIDLGHGVTVEVKPGGSGVVLAAGADMAAATDSGRLAFAKAVGRVAITSWWGVEDENGDSIPLSPEAVDVLMDEFPVFLAFERHYVNPLLMVVTEGNA
jgi:hypothetical protein